MSRKTYKFFAFAGLATSLGTFLFLHHAQGQSPKDGSVKTPAVPVTVATALKKDLPIQVQGLGTVVPIQTVALKSRIDSQITAVKFKDGDNVKAGDVLFLLDDRSLKADLNEAQANQARDEAQLENARKQYQRSEDLIQRKAISEKVFQDNKAAMDAQSAVVDSDKAVVESLKIQLSYTVIKAPIDGRTGTINVTVGNNIRANDTTPLVVINQIKPIQIQVALPQDYFDELRDAMATGPVTVKAVRSNSKEEMLGTFAYTDNTIDQSTGTFIGRAVFPNDDETLWPGMLANLTIDLSQDSQALTIPNVAVQNTATGHFVYVIENGKARKTDVDVERIQTDMAVISSGLKENEQVAVDGIMALRDGATVNIANVDNKKTQ
jgi:RND family efflux transporter MFP subunit